MPVSTAIAGIPESQDLNGNKVTLDGLSDSGKFILEGAGFGIREGDDDDPSPVTLEMVQRMDALFTAMSDGQRQDVADQVAGTDGVVDLVGGLSAMGVLDMNAADPTVTNFMPVFDALDDDAQAIVLKNADPLDLNSMNTVTNAVDKIEDLNAVLSGTTISGTALSDAISAVSTAIAGIPESQDLNGNKVTLDGLSDSGKFILEGAGHGIREGDDDDPSPVTLEMVQRMDALFTAMSDGQRQDVADQVAGTDGVVDLVGGLSAMGVLDMNAADPTVTNFMPVFDALDDDAQAIVLKNADPLDLNSMNTVTNAVDKIEDLNAVLSGTTISGTALSDAISAVSTAIAGIPESQDLNGNKVTLDGLSDSGKFILEGAGHGIREGDDDDPSPVTLEMVQRMDALFTAMSDGQRQDVADQVAGTDGVVDLVGGLSAMGVLDMNAADPTVTNFMPVFDALDDDAQAIVLKNADPLDLNSMNTVTNAVDKIEDLNAVLSGTTISGTALSDAISAVSTAIAGIPESQDLNGNKVTLDGLSDSGKFILEGAGHGIREGDDDDPSPVTLEMVQRMDALFTAMSDGQRQDVADQVAGTDGVVDLVGGLSAMGVLDMNAADPTVTNFMPVFDALDDDAQAIVLKNADPLDLNSMNTVTNAVDKIEDLNAVLSGTTISGTALSDAISAVSTAIAGIPESQDLNGNKVTLDGLSDSGKFILEGAGHGIREGDDDDPSPVTLEMVQRMDALFTAMSDGQRQDVADRVAGTDGVVDLVGGLSAMGVLDMNAADPTATNFMSDFDALDAEAQKLVLENADPLVQASMDAVTDAVVALRGLQGVVYSDVADGSLLVTAVSNLASKLDLIEGNGVEFDALAGAAGSENSVTAQNIKDADALLTAMSEAQTDEVLTHIQGLNVQDLTNLADLVAEYMGVDPDHIPAALVAFNDLGADRAELVFKTIAEEGGLSSLATGRGFESFVAAPMVKDVVASTMVSSGDDVIDDKDTSNDNSVGLSIAVIFDGEMNDTIAPVLTLSNGNDSLTKANGGTWNDAKTVFTQEYVVTDDGVDIDGITVTVSGAKDASGNAQLLQLAPAAAPAKFDIDTQNPTSGTIDIDVTDAHQTEGEAGTLSFTVATRDVDPGTIHVEMRGSEYRALSQIETEYDTAVNEALRQLGVAKGELVSLEGELQTAKSNRDGILGETFPNSEAIGDKAATLEGIESQFDGLQDDASALGDAVTTANALGVYYTQDQVDAAALANDGVVAGQPNPNATFSEQDVTAKAAELGVVAGQLDPATGSNYTQDQVDAAAGVSLSAKDPATQDQYSDQDVIDTATGAGVVAGQPNPNATFSEQDVTAKAAELGVVAGQLDPATGSNYTQDQVDAAAGVSLSAKDPATQDQYSDQDVIDTATGAGVVAGQPNPNATFSEQDVTAKAAELGVVAGQPKPGEEGATFSDQDVIDTATGAGVVAGQPNPNATFSEQDVTAKAAELGVVAGQLDPATGSNYTQDQVDAAAASVFLRRILQRKISIQIRML